MNVRARLDRWLMSRCPGDTLAAFRVLFGGLMAWEAFRLWKLEGAFLAKERFHFSYPLFEFVTPWKGVGTDLHFLFMGVSALGIALGLFYRVSSILFLLVYAWFFLSDKTLYNNHYYLLLLVAFLFPWVEANAALSIDALWNRRLKTGMVPFWNILLLRAQFLLVFFFGGLAKINGDWLRGDPLRQWLPQLAHSSPLKELLLQPWSPMFFSYSGLFFDLLIGLFLVWRRTRWAAIVTVVVFSVVNALIFPIGIFPFLMIASLVLFVDPGLIFRTLRLNPRAYEEVDSNKGWSFRLVPVFVGLYLAIQILLPLRHWFYPGNVDWTEEGHRFSWRMMLRDKDARIRITVSDPLTGETREVNLRDDLNARQRRIMAGFPDMIFQYVQFLKEKAKGRGIFRPIILVQDLVSLNGRSAQPLIDPEVNLAEGTYPLFGHAKWILPGPD